MIGLINIVASDDAFIVDVRRLCVRGPIRIEGRNCSISRANETMSDEIKVCVLNRGRKNLYLRYVDPMTGKPVEKSAETSK